MSKYKLPLIIINFKTYLESSGKNAVALAKIVDKVAKSTGTEYAVAVSALDLKSVVEAVTIPVFVQHVDNAKIGSSTGSVLPEFVKEMGAFGVLLNHSEKRLAPDSISGLVERCNQLGLITVLCAESDLEVALFDSYAADFVAIEPPELIGGEVSVSKANPEVISKSKKVLTKSKLIVGAGVKTGEDIKIGISLGAEGILLASGVCKSEDPEKVLIKLSAY